MMAIETRAYIHKNTKERRQVMLNEKLEIASLLKTCLRTCNSERDS